MTVLCKCRVRVCDMHILSTEKSYPYCIDCIRKRDELMNEHEPAIYKVAIDEVRFGSGSRLGGVHDCFQVAAMAMMRAIDLFDPNRKYVDKNGKEQNVKFISYAITSMKRCLRMACLDSGVVHVPHQEVTKAASDVEKEKADTKIVYRALNIGSLDAAKHDEIFDYRWDESVAEEVSEKQALVEKALSRIKDPRDNRIVTSRIFENKTLATIGEEHSIGKERARQLYTRSVAKIQEMFRVPVKSYRAPNKLGMKTNKRQEPEKLGVCIAPKND